MLEDASNHHARDCEPQLLTAADDSADSSALSCNEQPYTTTAHRVLPSAHRITFRDLDFLESDGNSLRYPTDSELEDLRAAQKWVIMPVALPGVGRSLICTALGLLFGFHVIRNTSVTEAAYADHVSSRLVDHDVVISDRDNFMALQRRSLRGLHHDAKILCLNWDISEQALSAVETTCIARMLHAKSMRGTIVAGVEKAVTRNVRHFLEVYEPFDDCEADACIDMSASDDFRMSLRRVIGGVVALLCVEPPTTALFFEALSKSHDYTARPPTAIRSKVVRSSVPLKPRTKVASARLWPVETLDCGGDRPLMPTQTTVPRLSSSHNARLASIRSETTYMVERLSLLEAQGSHLVKSRRFSAADGLDVTCWKFLKRAFYESRESLPILARGLWTRRVTGGEHAGDTSWDIVARCYDKIYTVEEFDWLKWSSLAQFTRGPAYVTVKSNGALIMVSALTPLKLLVTSKNSTGSNQVLPVSHAQKAEKWLEKQLVAIGKTQKALAFCLWKLNWTLCCELCDDDFEEHVLEVPADQAGLHLHGINTRSVAFETENPDIVASFAQEWGFFPTPYQVLDSIQSVAHLVAECGRYGVWDGRPIEGFVVRTTVGPPVADALSTYESGLAPPPYPINSPLFFKVKFEEPYLLYRSFREITACLLRGEDMSSLAQMKDLAAFLDRPMTKVYVTWVTSEISRRRSDFDGFLRHRGIISTRQRFLQWLRTSEGRSMLDAQEYNARELHREISTVASVPQRRRWIIFFVGMPGCGKTAISIALAHLFGFVHIEHGRIKSKRKRTAAASFLTSVASALGSHTVVIADGSSHLRKHRDDLRKAAMAISVPFANLLAVNWPSPSDFPAHQALLQSVVARRSSPTEDPAKVLYRYLSNCQSMAAGEADFVVPLNYEDNLEGSLAQVLRSVCSIIEVPLPDPAAIWEALELALASPRAKQTHASRAFCGSSEPDPPTYYALVPSANILSTVGHTIRSPGAPPSLRSLWQSICEDVDASRLMFHRPHVTLVHQAQLGSDETDDLWQACRTISKDVTLEVLLRTLIYNDRIVVAVVDAIRGRDEASSKVAASLPQIVRDRLHLVVARRSLRVAPVEALSLLALWRRDESAVSSVALIEGVTLIGDIQGLRSQLRDMKSAAAVESVTPIPLEVVDPLALDVETTGMAAGEQDDDADKAPNPQARAKSLGKLLSNILRHNAAKFGLKMRDDGYVRVDDLLALPMFRGQTRESIQTEVARNQKKRFKLVEEKDRNDDDTTWYVRANNGHTIQTVNVAMQEVQDASQILMALHTTTPRAWKSIFKEGISRMRRQHIHLLPKRDYRLIPRNSDIFIYLDVQKAMNSGIKFFLSENNVILTPGDERGSLSPELFSRVVDIRSGRTLRGFNGPETHSSAAS